VQTDDRSNGSGARLRKLNRLEEILQGLGKTINSEPGAQPKLSPEQYPCCWKQLKCCNQLFQNSLQFQRLAALWRDIELPEKGLPRACEFLSQNIHRFRQALEDPTLLQRAKKSKEGRSRVLAEAMAGANYQLTFSTSRERVRRARLTQTTSL